MTERRFQCKACRQKASLTVGTVMEPKKLCLTTWFLGIFPIGQAKIGLLAMVLMGQVGISYPTVWRIHHKLMTAMGERE